jgi:hypothetical protein
MDYIIDSLIDLINAAQRISDGGFDVQAFLTWKTVAFITLFGLLGPFNYYTRNFGRFTTEASRDGLLAGKGILVAVTEQLSKRGFTAPALQAVPEKCESGSDCVPWVDRHKKWRSLAFLKQVQTNG